MVATIEAAAYELAGRGQSLRPIRTSLTMNIETSRMAAWMQPEQILLDVSLRDVRHALEFIAESIATAHGLEGDVVFRALSRREQAGSTALGGGLAIPHARILGIDQPLTLLVRAKPGLAFHAPDGEPVTLLLAILVPAHGDPGEHLNLLALISQMFSRPGFRAGLDAAGDATEAGRTIRLATEALAG